MVAEAHTSIEQIHFQYPELKNSFASFEITLHIKSFAEIRECMVAASALKQFFTSDILAPVTFTYHNNELDHVTGVFEAFVDFSDKVLELFLNLLLTNLKPGLHDRFSEKIKVTTEKQIFHLNVNINEIKNKKIDP